MVLVGGRGGLRDEAWVDTFDSHFDSVARWDIQDGSNGENCVQLQFSDAIKFYFYRQSQNAQDGIKT